MAAAADNDVQAMVTISMMLQYEHNRTTNGQFHASFYAQLTYLLSRQTCDHKPQPLVVKLQCHCICGWWWWVLRASQVEHQRDRITQWRQLYVGVVGLNHNVVFAYGAQTNFILTVTTAITGSSATADHSIQNLVPDQSAALHIRLTVVLVDS